MTAWIVAAILAVTGLVGAVWRSRQKIKREAEGWRASAEAERRARDADARVAKEQEGAALETQRALDKEIRDAATARLRNPDPGARVRVQERWGASAGADREDRLPAAVQNGAAGGAGADPARDARMRGKR